MTCFRPFRPLVAILLALVIPTACQDSEQISEPETEVRDTRAGEVGTPSDPAPPLAGAPDLRPVQGSDSPELRQAIGTPPALLGPEEGNGGIPAAFEEAGTTTVQASATADGKNDLLWRNISTGGIVAWLMEGTVKADQTSIGSVSTAWQIVAVGDFEGSGTPDDIVWRNQNNGDIVIWTMGGTSRTSTTSVGSVSTVWEIRGTGDFEGSGTRDDILWRNQNNGDIVVWIMSGTSRTSTTSVGSVATVWDIRAVGDFEETGTPDDYLWRNSNTGDIAVWLMSGTSRTSTTAIGTVNLDWAIRATGDHEADGFVNDVVWRRPSTGDNAVWEMDGTSRTNTVQLDDVGNSDWRIVGTGAFTGSDLEALDLEFRPTGLLTTETTTAEIFVRNPNGNVSSFDWRILEGSTVLASGTEDPAPSGTFIIDVSGLGPFSQGDHRLAAELDPADAISESDETNNRAEAPLDSRSTGYDIEIQFVDSPSQDAKDLIPSQVTRWEGMIAGDLRNFNPSTGLDLDACFSDSPGAGTRTTEIDDVLILVRETAIDGMGGTLARAGPCYIRFPADAEGDLPRMPLVGRVILDEDDVAGQSTSLMEEVVAHEMGHVFGLLFGPFGGTDADFAENTGSGDGHCLWVGSSAVFRYQNVGGTQATPPIEEDACGHWEEAEFDDEMMTPFASDPAHVSEVSLGALADRSYAVDFSAAESYSISSASLRGFSTGERISLGDHIQLAPLYGIDLATGRVQVLVGPDERTAGPGPLR